MCLIKNLKASAKNNHAELIFYGDVGGWDGISAAEFQKAVSELGDGIKNITLRLHSYGGDVYDGQAIYNTLKRHSAKVRVEVDGAAMSAASFIAMAGDEIAMAENAIFMIHDPWTVVMGNARDMREMADSMDKVRDTITGVYHSRTGLASDNINDLMAAETYFDASEALEYGFASEVIPNKGIDDMSTSVIRNRWKNCPEFLIEGLEQPAIEAEQQSKKLENMRRRVAVFSQFRG